MSFWDDVKDVATVGINPTAFLGTGLAFADSIGNYIGSERDRKAAQEANEKNIQYQKEFAQQGLRWRVDDARAAGINPLAALGFSGPSFQANVMPVSSGDSYRAIGSGLANMGQNIARAAQATITSQERKQIDLENAYRLEKMGLENELLRHQITKIDEPTNPAYPAAMAPEGQLVEDVNKPGTFIMMPSMESAMASQGDWSYPLTFRTRMFLGSKQYLDPGVYPVPEKYRKRGMTIFRKRRDGTYEPVGNWELKNR